MLRLVATALPPVDTGQVAAFWQRFLATGTVEPGTPVPEVVEPRPPAPTLGVEFDPDMATVFERFEVLFSE